jgi:hypothetical protein
LIGLHTRLWEREKQILQDFSVVEAYMIDSDSFYVCWFCGATIGSEEHIGYFD